MPWCRAHSGTCDQILLPVGRLLSENCGLVSVGRPLWREDGSVVCSAIIQWSESCNRNRTLLPHLRLAQPGGYVFCSAICQWSELSHLRQLGSLSVASYYSQELRWKYSNPLPHGIQSGVEVEVTLRLSQSANMCWYRVPLWDLRPDIISCRYLYTPEWQLIIVM
jgi:hypothetical protein